MPSVPEVASVRPSGEKPAHRTEPSCPASVPAGRQFVVVHSRARPSYRAGYYANFVEEPADASAFFDPTTWARLRAAKAAYDPAGLFVGNHHIPPAGRP